MKKAQILLTAVLVLLAASGGIAQSKTLTDGTIVEQTACPPNVVGTYEQYTEAAKSDYARTIENAKRDGIKMEMPADFSKRG